MEMNIANSELKERAITFLSKIYKHNGFEKKAMQEILNNTPDKDKKQLMADIITMAISDGAVDARN